MDTLRIILIVLGVVLVAGIWLADRFKRRRPNTSHYRSEVIPDEVGESFSAMDGPLSMDWTAQGESISARRYQPLADEQLDELKGINSSVDDAEVTDSAPEKVVSQEVIALTVMAREDKLFSGPLVLKVLQEVGLEHGDMGLFHYHLAGRREPLFSVANLLEPGSFQLSEIATLQTPGLLLFMRLPAIVEGELALQTLLQKARQMAAQLSATLCDEQRLPLDEETLARFEKLARGYGAS